MCVFKIYRVESIDRFLPSENPLYRVEIIAIFYENFVICKIIFLTMAGIGSWWYIANFDKFCFAMSDIDDIFPIVGFQDRMCAGDHVEEMTSF